MKPFSLDEYLKNPSRKVVTRDGRKVRVIYTDKKGRFPVVALVEQDAASESVFAFTNDGKYLNCEIDAKDLFFAPEKHEGWLNIYRSENGFYLRGNPYKSKEKAEEVAKANNKTFCTTIKIEWEE